MLVCPTEIRIACRPIRIRRAVRSQHSAIVVQFDCALPVGNRADWIIRPQPAGKPRNTLGRRRRIESFGKLELVARDLAACLLEGRRGQRAAQFGIEGVEDHGDLELAPSLREAARADRNSPGPDAQRFVGVDPQGIVEAGACGPADRPPKQLRESQQALPRGTGSSRLLAACCRPPRSSTGQSASSA